MKFFTCYRIVSLAFLFFGLMQGCMVSTVDHPAPPDDTNPDDITEDASTADSDPDDTDTVDQRPTVPLKGLTVDSSLRPAAPVPNAIVLVDTWSGFKTVRSDKNGFFSIPVPEGVPVTASAFQKGHRTVTYADITPQRGDPPLVFRTNTLIPALVEEREITVSGTFLEVPAGYRVNVYSGEFPRNLFKQFKVEEPPTTPTVSLKFSFQARIPGGENLFSFTGVAVHPETGEVGAVALATVSPDDASAVEVDMAAREIKEITIFTNKPSLEGMEIWESPWDPWEYPPPLTALAVTAIGDGLITGRSIGRASLNSEGAEIRLQYSPFPGEKNQLFVKLSLPKYELNAKPHTATAARFHLDVDESRVYVKLLNCPLESWHPIIQAPEEGVWHQATMITDQLVIWEINSLSRVLPDIRRPVRFDLFPSGELFLSARRTEYSWYDTEVDPFFTEHIATSFWDSYFYPRVPTYGDPDYVPEDWE